MAATPREIYERYVWATAMTRDADAVAEMFTADGVIEAPLVAAGRVFPRRMEGRDEIRAGLAAYYQRLADADRQVNVNQVNVNKSRYVLHGTDDPDVFIVEIDTVFDGPGQETTLSLVKIFRIRDGKIALLRDYFASEQVD